MAPEPVTQIDPEPEILIEPEPEFGTEPDQEIQQPETKPETVSSAPEKQQTDSSPDTGDRTPLGAICLLGMAALAAGGLVTKY